MKSFFINDIDLTCMVNAIVTGDLTMQGDRVSAALLLTHFSQNGAISEPAGLSNAGEKLKKKNSQKKFTKYRNLFSYTHS